MLDKQERKPKVALMEPPIKRERMKKRECFINVCQHLFSYIAEVEGYFLSRPGTPCFSTAGDNSKSVNHILIIQFSKLMSFYILANGENRQIDKFFCKAGRYFVPNRNCLADLLNQVFSWENNTQPNLHQPKKDRKTKTL